MFKVFFLSIAMLAANIPAYAQGNWVASVMNDGSGVFAAVINDSNAVFGRLCTFKDENCIWIVANNLSCVQNELYPALASSTQSAHIQLICDGKSDARAYRYLITPFDTIDGLVAKGGILGIAMVADNGNFRVNRFDLDGARRILDQADAMFQNRARRKDQSL